MPKNLLIVESPAKAKTIEKYLGSEFTVKSSFGHVRDLNKGDKGVDIENNFEPSYAVTPEKKKVVKELASLVKKVDEVWLATDEDREGEAISWHLCKVLGLDENETKRIVFREITKPAIQKAIQNPRKVDLNLVNAQQARRVLDRLVGFELSEILWKKVKNKLSAGRVQSVAVKLIVEREREINNFKSQDYFRIKAIFMVRNKQGNLVELQANGRNNYNTFQEALDFVQSISNSEFSIKDIVVKPTTKKPAAPFTTSTLQQEASRKMGFAVKRTMMAAQKLYEQGFITYMRTDSTNLSETAIHELSDAIKQEFGDHYLQVRRFSKKKELAQEAHEAIRPTYIQRKNVSGDRDQQRLYELIWKRTIASQMADAKLEKTQVDIEISGNSNMLLLAEGEVLKFDGFLKVYLESKDDDNGEEAKGMLPPLSIGQVLELDHLKAEQKFTRPLARFTEAMLVKKLEELGIGRPSTYAPTISKIMEEGRGYVVKESRAGVERAYQVITLRDGEVTQQTNTEVTGATTNRLYPTDMGMVVSDFLEEHFEQVMNYGFTADIEKQFDQIAKGDFDWKKMISDFYGPFHEEVETTLENADRATGERVLGQDENTGKTILVRMSRFGPVVQIGAMDELEEDEKPRYANLRPGQSLETIELSEALELFQLPKILGDYDGKEVSIGAGRYGPYVKYNSGFISLPRGEDPLSVSLDRAIELIEEKKKSEAPFGYYEDKPITKGKGRFGPFLKWNDMFVNIPRRIDPETISLEQSIELIKAKAEKEANRYIHQWPDEKISVENGRWGPFIRFKKKSISFPKVDGKKMDAETAKSLTLEDVKKIIETASN